MSDYEEEPQLVRREEVDDFTRDWVVAQPRVAAFLKMTTRDQNDVDDLLQKVAVAAFRKYDRYDRSKSFPAWVIGIARNELLMFNRKSARDRLAFDVQMVNDLADRSERLGAQWDDYREALHECLERLSKRSRKAISMRYAESLNAPQIGRLLGVSAGNARILLTRARAALRLCIEKRVGGGSSG